MGWLLGVGNAKSAFRAFNRELIEQERPSVSERLHRNREVKVLLDLLEKLIGYKGGAGSSHNAEAALHKFVVPMRATSHDITLDQHNLWIIDDKLTYYELWASDKQIKQIIADSLAQGRPDALLFGGRTAFHRPGTDQPVVVIEFKKPVRDDYTDDENPFEQVLGYIDDLRGGKVLDNAGGQIQEVTDSTPFYAYIIADMTPRLGKWMGMYQIDVTLPGGGGAYGYNPTYKCFFHVLSYKYVLKDARLRNEAFFKRLGI